MNAGIETRNVTFAAVLRAIPDQFYSLSTISLAVPVFVQNSSQYITVIIECPVLGIFFEVQITPNRRQKCLIKVGKK